MLVHQLLPGRRLQEIEAAILAAAAPAAHRGDDVTRLIDKDRIARKLLYPAYEIGLSNKFPGLASALISGLAPALIFCLAPILILIRS